MKNIVLASVLGLGLISSVWATETVNIHEASTMHRLLLTRCSLLLL
jgi:hypothetical protein